MQKVNTGNDDIDESLLVSYLTGEPLDDDDRAEVEQWLSAETNVQRARELYRGWELSGLVGDRKVDVTGALSAVRARIGLSKNTKTFRLSRWVSVGIAAAVLIATGWLLVRDTSNLRRVVISATAEPLEHHLPDNSRVVLRVGSTLAFDSTTFEPSVHSRRLHLSGEAWFDVMHDERIPFLVITNDAQIRVLGTSFLVKAYPGKPVEVLVAEGRVGVTVLSSRAQYIVEAGDQIEMHPSLNPRLKAMDENTIYWRTGVLKFENDSLGTVLETLRREFALTVTIADSSILNCKLTATFRRQSIETIMKVIEQTHRLQIRRNDNEIIIDGNGCN